VDVFKLVPNKFLTQNEIDASNQVHFDELNVQNQPKIIWPSNFVIARAYLDQLTRSSALSPERIAALNAAITKVEASHSDHKAVTQLKAMAMSLDKDAAATRTTADADRMRALSAIMKENGTSHR
jgi:hypothetical protein